MDSVPGLSLLGGLVPGMPAAAQRAPTLPPEALASLRSAGLIDGDTRPLTEKDWADYERFVGRMAQAGGGEMPDLAGMRAAIATSPQLAGMVRAQMSQFRDIEAEQARMRDAYARMDEAERQEAVAELVKTLQALQAQDRGAAWEVIGSEAVGLPEEVKARMELAAKGNR